MKLACADDTFRLFEHEHILALIHMLGLDGVDLCLMEGRSAVRPGDVQGDVAAWAGLLEERIRGHALELADVFVIPWTDFRGLAPNHPDPLERDRSRLLFRRHARACRPSALARHDDPARHRLGGREP